MHAEELIGIQARIEDAGVLGDAGRYEGALLMLLVAVAATSKERYPELGDGEAFKRFLRDEMWRLVKEHEDVVRFRGKQIPIEDFLYKYLRNALFHEGQLPLDLHPAQGGDVITIDYGDGTGVSFTGLLLARLNDVVWRAAENSYEVVRDDMEARRARAEELAPRIRGKAGKRRDQS